jgi:hypothetical protein
MDTSVSSPFTTPFSSPTALSSPMVAFTWEGASEWELIHVRPNRDRTRASGYQATLRPIGCFASNLRVGKPLRLQYLHLEGLFDSQIHFANGYEDINEPVLRKNYSGDNRTLSVYVCTNANNFCTFACVT